MFSSRLHWDLAPNPLSVRLAKMRRDGRQVLDLTESNPTAAGLDYPAREILDALAGEHGLCYEPEPAGLASAREAVRGYYATRNIDLAADRILLTTSTSEAYAYLFKLLTDPGDEILVPRPSYPLFEFLAGMELVKIVHYPLHYHGGWWMDLDALEAAITERTRAVVVVHPNNPTGSFVKVSEATRLKQICAARGIAILSDEVFADYGFTPDQNRLPTFAGPGEVLTFSLSGLSKVAGLPQVKLGWMVTGGPEVQQRAALERLELIADTYLSVSTPVQHAATRLIEAGRAVQRQIRERTARNLERSRVLKPLDVEGGWYAIVEIPRTRSEEEWTTSLLEQEGVLVQPGYYYDFEGEGHLVISLLTEPRTFDEGVSRMSRHLEQSG